MTTTPAWSATSTWSTECRTESSPGPSPRWVDRTSPTQVPPGAVGQLATPGADQPREIERDRFMQTQLDKVDQLLDNGEKEAALGILRAILERYPDAQDIRERIRVIK